MPEIVLAAKDRDGVRRAVATVCQVVTEERFELLGERALDLSPDGMLLETAAEPRIGESVFVSLRAPGTQLWIDAEATVARIVRGRRGSDRTQGVGLRFRKMDRMYRAVLQESLRGFPPPLPGRFRRKDYASTVRAIAGS